MAVKDGGKPMSYSLSARRSAAEEVSSGVVGRICAWRFLAHMTALCALLALSEASVRAKAQSIDFNNPEARWGAAMAYDAAHGQVVLFGGGNQYDTFGDTWTWNGTSWTLQGPSKSPPARAWAAMAYDAAAGQIILFGGWGPSAPSEGFFDDTWTWDGTTWTQQTPATSPPARLGASMAYDAEINELVLFGGEGENGDLSDTWFWDVTSWAPQATQPDGPMANYSMMAYDAAQSQLLLFGGENSIDPVGETWTWNGTNWTEQSPTTHPGGIYGAAMAYDAGQSNVVMFGGVACNDGIICSGTYQYLNNTWTWDGTNWTEQTPATSPSARYWVPMAYDTSQSQAVLFGGSDPNGFPFSDTWTWDGTNWTPQSRVNLGTANVCPSGASTPAPCSQSTTLNFIITAVGVGSIAYLTEGAPNLDFKQSSTAGTCVARVYSISINCTVNVTFAPTVPGPRNGSVVFYSGANGTGTVLGSVLVYGIGAGPQAVFNSPVTQSSLGGGGFGDVFDVAVDGSENVYFTEVGKVNEIPAGCASSSCVTPLGGGFNIPVGVAVDGGGNVYAADWANSAVDEIPAGCTSSICVSSLGGGFSGPYGVAVTGNGTVYVADFVGSAVYEMSAGCLSASCMTAMGGGFTSPYAVAVDTSGNIYVADAGAPAVFQVPGTCTAAEYSLLSSLGPFTCVNRLGGGGFAEPTGVAVDTAGNVYVTDSKNNAEYQMPPGCASASCVTVLGTGFSGPSGVALDGGGNLFVGDDGNGMVKELNRATLPALTFDATNAGQTSADSPQTVTVENIGSASLSFSAISFPADFPEESSAPATACSTSAALASGGLCTLSLDFSPQPTSPPGALSESVSLTDNMLNAAHAVQLISLKGTNSHAGQTIDFTPPASPVSYGVSPIALVATGGNSGNPVTFTVLSGPGTISSNTLTVTGVGTIKIAANQEGSSDYEAAAQVTATIVVNQGSQTIAFTPASPVMYGAPPIALTAKGGDSGNPVTFSIVSGPGFISGGALTVIGVGTVVVAANQAGNADYAAAPQVTANIQVNQASQTIAFSPPSPVVFGVSPIALSATGGASGNPVTFKLVSGPGSINGSTLTVTGAGTIVLAANQAGNNNYAAAAQVTADIIVHQATQTVNFAAITGKEHAESTLKLSATASSRLPVSFASTTTKVCTVSETTAKLLIAGTCTLQASQAGNVDYSAAPKVSHTFTVLHAGQDITFPAITAKEFTLSVLKLNATASSKLPVSFASATPRVCTVLTDEASLHIEGSCTIVASQAGNDIYGAAAKESRSFKVLPHSQSITFPAIADQTVGKPLTLKATASSKLAVSFASTTTAICKVTGTTASMLTAGTCTIEATQSGDLVYAAAPPISRSFAVVK
jgi:hypothetical protein